MIDTEYLEILRCPHCTGEGGGELAEARQDWLVCTDCGRNYPVVQDIPVMLPEEGDKWRDTAVDDLTVIESHDRFVSTAG